MKPWRRSRAVLSSLLPAALVAGALLFPLSSEAAVEEGRVIGRVNGEAITEADAAGAGGSLAPGAPRPEIIRKTVENALLVQEARRRKVGESRDYRYRLRQWRRRKSEGLIGVDILWRFMKERGEEAPFAEFYPRWGGIYDSLPPGEHSAVDGKVETRLADLRVQSRFPFDTKAVEQYVHMVEIPPAEALQAVVARTFWASVTLDEVLYYEPKNLGHVGQSPEDVTRMWQQITDNLLAQEFILNTAEEEGLFEAEGLEAEEELVSRRLLMDVLVEGHLAEKLTIPALLEGIGRNAGAWTPAYGLEVEIAMISPASRMEAEAALPGWKESGVLPAGASRETLPLDKGWGKLSPGQRRVAMEQLWNGFSPPLREGEGYIFLQVRASDAPHDISTLRILAESILGQEVYRELIDRLTGEADIQIQ